MIKELFSSYEFTYFSEHDILSIENENDGLKFVFYCYREQFIIDVYSAMNELAHNENTYKTNLFWSEPDCFTFFIDTFSLNDIKKIKIESQLKNIFKKK